VKPYSVQFTAVAVRHLRTIDEWWEANRLGAPRLFARELTEAVQQVMDAPHSGSPYDAPRPAGARRLLLRRTGYHVYFTVDDARSLVTIRAIWHTARGRPPRLH
jgi:plasmid stabilization system protein ParE